MFGNFKDLMVRGLWLTVVALDRNPGGVTVSIGRGPTSVPEIERFVSWGLIETLPEVIAHAADEIKSR